ncbi:MAG: hypothetical protein AAF694_24195 [Bacteroidota bacterium]
MTRFFKWPKVRTLVYLFGLLFWGYSCVDSSPPPTEAGMQFRVNEELLGDSVHFPLAGASFSPPKTFHIHSSLEKTAMLSQAQVDSFLIYEIYEDTTRKAEDLLAYMAFMHPRQGQKEKFEAYIETLLDSALLADPTVGEVLQDSFMYKGFAVRQSMVQAKEYVSFFLAFTHSQDQAKAPFACSYFIPRESYTLPMIESIESSIGSFSPI